MIRAQQRVLSMGLAVLLTAWNPSGQTDPAPTSPETDVQSISNLAIPKDLGKIEIRKRGASSRWIIHIQDVHAHFTAQENIAAILDHLNALYGITTVAVEGGWSSSDLPESWALPSSREKQDLAKALLEEDYLTGPPYAALFSQSPINLVGIEDESLYEKNRRVYLNRADHQTATASLIESFETNIKSEKGRLFNPDLKKFDFALSHFREGKKAEEFIPSVVAMAVERQIDLADLDQIELFKQAFAMEASIEKEKIESEAGRLLKTFKRERLGFEELLRSQKIPDDKLQYYPETRKYLELLTLQDAIDHRTFFIQIEEAIRRIKESLFQSQEEQVLDAHSERFVVTKRILLFQATPDDLNFYESSSELLRADIEPAGLFPAFDLALEFYSLAKDRDRIFFEKITTHPELTGNIAVVTGGFHTEGLSQQLDAAGLSYIVITPDLGKDPAPDESLYWERLNESLPSSQTLAHIRNRFLTARFDKAFVQGARQYARDRNRITAVETVKTYQIGPTGDSAAAPAVSVDFASLPRNAQNEIVRDYRNMQQGEHRVVALIKLSVLKELLKDPVALTIWSEEILSRRENTVMIIKDIDEVLTEAIGGRAVIKRVEPADFDAIITQEKSKVSGEKALYGVIDSNYKSSAETLVLPSHPVSLLLLRPMLEYKDSRLAAMDEAVLNLLHSILEEIYLTEGILRSA